MKKENKRIKHVIDRALERYKIVLAVEDIETMEAMIARDDKKARLIGYYEDGDARYAITRGAEVLRVMYSPREHAIKSVLPDYRTAGGVFRVSQSLGTEKPRRRTDQQAREDEHGKT